MIFLKKRPMCVMCGIFKSAERMSEIYDSVGICNSCSDELKLTKDCTFDGKGHIEMVVSPFMYCGNLRKAVRAFKFSGQFMYGRLFGSAMCKRLNVDIFDGFDAIVPVPLHENRYNERGYNQSEILAESLSEYSGVEIMEDCLVRVKDTKRQSALRGKERIENVKDAFISRTDNVKDKNIILVDDIYTAGETAKSCADALKAGGAGRIIAVTLCKSEIREKHNY